MAESLDLLGDGDLGLGEPVTSEALVADDIPVKNSKTREQAAVQRCVGDEGQPELLTSGRELSFGGPVDEVVLHLGGDGCMLTPVVRNPQGTYDLPGGMVGQPDIADLSLPDEIVIRRQGLLQWSVRVGIVGVVEVDVVGLQTAQARLDLANDVST